MILGETVGRGRSPGLSSAAGLAYAASRVVGSRLYGVAPQDPLTLALATGLLLLVALGAAYVPALRASRVEPMSGPAAVLRAEFGLPVHHVVESSRAPMSVTPRSSTSKFELTTTSAAATNHCCSCTAAPVSERLEPRLRERRCGRLPRHGARPARTRALDEPSLAFTSPGGARDVRGAGEVGDPAFGGNWMSMGAKTLLHCGSCSRIAWTRCCW